MIVAFIGAGKVGTALGLYLNNYDDISVAGYYSASKNSAMNAATITNSKTYDQLESLIKQTDIIAITTPDDQIAHVSKQLVELNIKNKIIFHTSGVHSSEMLEPLYEQGATVLSVHPLLSFANPEKTVKELYHTFFTVEGKGTRLEIFHNILNKLSNPWISILPADKTSYHAAASIVSNFLVTLLDIGIHILIDIGLTKEQATQIIKPLVQKTVNNIFDEGTEYALTGPIARGDIGTVKKHLNHIQHSYQDIVEIYKALGIKTVDLANKANKIDSTLSLELKEVLKKDE